MKNGSHLRGSLLAAVIWVSTSFILVYPVIQSLLLLCQEIYRNIFLTTILPPNHNGVMTLIQLYFFIICAM